MPCMPYYDAWFKRSQTSSLHLPRLTNFCLPRAIIHNMEYSGIHVILNKNNSPQQQPLGSTYMAPSSSKYSLNSTTRDISLVGCGLTSHSEIFQLYSDGTVVQFPNFDLLPGTQRHGQLVVFGVPSLPRHGHRDVKRCLKPPCHQSAHTQWGYAGNRTRIFRSTVQPATSTPPRQAGYFVVTYIEHKAKFWTHEVSQWLDMC